VRTLTGITFLGVIKSSQNRTCVAHQSLGIGQRRRARSYQ
jgi:hypothetical protein